MGILEQSFLSGPPSSLSTIFLKLVIMGYFKWNSFLSCLPEHQKGKEKHRFFFFSTVEGFNVSECLPLFFLILNLRIFLIEGCLFYRTVLFSAKHQHESAIGLHMSPPSWTSPIPPYPSHPSRLLQSPGLSSLSHTANSHGLSILRMVMDALNF